MKRLFVLLLIFIFIIGFVACSGNGEEAEVELESSGDIDWDFFNEKATTFVMATAGGDYDVAVSMFNEAVGQAFGVDELQATWEGIVDIAGDFIGIHEIQNGQADGYFISGVIMRHENVGFGWNIVFSEDGLIAGLNAGGTTPLPEDTVNNQNTSPVGFTDYPIIIGEGTDYPLNGLLSIPDDAVGAVPAVVIVGGSGPHDMDGSIVGSPYRDIAEFLAANGIATIRYDKRTYIHGARMVQELGGSFTIWEESVEDAILAADLLRRDPRIDGDRIFIIGHSLGGMIAPRIHVEGGDFAGLILMASSPRCVLELMVEQSRASAVAGIAQIEWAVEEGLIEEEDGESMIEAAGIEMLLAETELMEELMEMLGEMSSDVAKETEVPLVGGMAYYYKEMAEHSFVNYVQEITIPILVMQGDRDFQILADVDFILLEELFADRNNVTFKLYEGLNHVFMPSTATNFIEHGMEVVSGLGRLYTPILQDIVNWINEK